MSFDLKMMIVLLFLLVLVSGCSGRSAITADDFYRGIYDITVQDPKFRAPGRIGQSINHIPSYGEYKFDLHNMREAQNSQRSWVKSNCLGIIDMDN
ncbi:hypothetical protein [uncultured Desulfobacter sp.]|uniref:hypothetical protein n=1 Tax=uncultured Desulfobacter sp. TaxID=240139 RepID=UPI0029F5CB48|nr:hypothetical protein [uncultured Desulfobacter sp.]